MACARDAAAEQLINYGKEHKADGSATSSAGNPVSNKSASLTVGRRGPVLLEDYDLLDELGSFDHERIPERVVHAKGGGAFGYFEVTHDITKYTAAKLYNKVGKKTAALARFSTVVGEKGSADTNRDPRGFALKFYTEDGIYDMVGNNTPVFFVRDAILFPSFIHSQKRNPVTNVRSWDQFWDFISLRPETLHQIMITFSDRGTPDGFRHMNGYGSHTYTFINAKAETTFVKFHYKTDQKIKNLPAAKAKELAGNDPDYAIRDLYNSIATGNYPSWSMYIQVMSVEDAKNQKTNPFDVTKVWSQKDYPLMPVGKLVLNRNPINYFAEIEQSAFSPADFIPGIGPSPDKMLQGRLFSYGDTHRHRLGPNYLQLPVNCPFRVRNFQRDGSQTIDSQGGAPNYHPNSFGGPDSDLRAQFLKPPYQLSGDVYQYDSGNADNYTQPRNMYQEVLNEAERERLAENISSTLKCAAEFIQQRTVEEFKKVDEDLANKINKGLSSKPHATL